nr:MAG TPA: hypothetical protein [Caudoviricetes sp.]
MLDFRTKLTSKLINMNDGILATTIYNVTKMWEF